MPRGTLHAHRCKKCNRADHVDGDNYDGSAAVPTTNKHICIVAAFTVTDASVPDYGILKMEHPV